MMGSDNEQMNEQIGKNIIFNQRRQINGQENRLFPMLTSTLCEPPCTIHLEFYDNRFVARLLAEKRALHKDKHDKISI